jgi:hypothetical protein
VIPAGRELRTALAAPGEPVAFDFVDSDRGSDYDRTRGVVLPPHGLDATCDVDATLFD